MENTQKYYLKFVHFKCDKIQEYNVALEIQIVLKLISTIIYHYDLLICN